MTTQQLRELFVQYFVDRGHLAQPSAPLVLHDDPTSLFTSAGMQPYMSAFRGETKPPASKVTSIQRCLRTNDIEGVGFHNRYATFFEMLGNFSFGDYFKEGAIEMAWDLMTNVLRLPTEHLYVTVYTDDDEAERIWHEHIGVPMDRISRLGRSDNWWPKERWEGPCGPCSEIHLDLGPEFGCDRPDCAVGCDCDRYLELWNLVFQMYTEAEDGTLTPLPKPGIDTGMGLERLALVMQGVRHLGETDEMAHIARRITDVISDQSGTELRYGQHGRSDLALRIIADHIRAAVFTQAGGVVPSNEGAGYVLRRFIRRSYRYGRQLGATEPFLHRVVPAVTEAMGQHHRELAEREEFSSELVRREEERFASTLRQGMGLFERVVGELEQEQTDAIPGEKAFTLYDTYGFPVELTVELAAERGLQVDMEGFQEAMEAQRVRSGMGSAGLAGARQELSLAQVPATEFVGYDHGSSQARVVALIADDELVEMAKAEQEVAVVLDQTPFYAEQGGQVGDSGSIQMAGAELAVRNTTKRGDKTLHIAVLKRGSVQVGDEVSATVDSRRRHAVMRNHTGTHLLHAALRQVLGEHVSQSGSLVAPDRLRFDFTHHEAVSTEQLTEIERLCNQWILDDRPVQAEDRDYEDAIRDGAIAIFTEKYDKQVRTISTEGVSTELCGGTHVSRTAQIGSFHIVDESSVAAGIRRIEALTGMGAAEHHRHLADQVHALAVALGSPPEQIGDRVAQLRDQISDLNRRLEKASSSGAAMVDVPSLLESATDVAGVHLISAHVPEVDRKLLGQLADQLATQLSPAVVLLGSAVDDKVALVCKADKAALAAGAHAGKLVSEAARSCDGGGGGRPDFAEGAGRDGGKLDQALAGAEVILRQQLGG